MGRGGARLKNRRVWRAVVSLVHLPTFGPLCDEGRCRRVRKLWRQVTGSTPGQSRQAPSKPDPGRPFAPGSVMGRLLSEAPKQLMPVRWLRQELSDHDRGGGPRVGRPASAGGGPDSRGSRRGLGLDAALAVGAGVGGGNLPALLAGGSAPASMHSRPSHRGGKTPRRSAPGLNPRYGVQPLCGWGRTGRIGPTPGLAGGCRSPGREFNSPFPLVALVWAWVRNPPWMQATATSRVRDRARRRVFYVSTRRSPTDLIPGDPQGRHAEIRDRLPGPPI